MDIHKPKPWHGGREFLREYATILLSILTAIVLEQTVEMVHRQVSRGELRESLRRETDQILLDTARVEKSEHAEVLWEKQIEGLLVASSKTHQALVPLPPEPRLDFDIPDNPVYRTAQSSGQLNLLSKEEREVYSEMDGLLVKTSTAYSHRGDAIDIAIQDHGQVLFGRSTGSTGFSDYFLLSASFTRLAGYSFSSEDVEKLFNDTVRLEVRAADFLFWSRQVRGAATALHRGDRKLRTVQAAERQFDHLP